VRARPIALVSDRHVSIGAAGAGNAIVGPIHWSREDASVRYELPLT